MTKQDLYNVCLGGRQALLEGSYLLEGLDDDQYVSCPMPLMQSSIGQHMRHVLDLWMALLPAIKDSSVGTVDYDLRRRGHAVESDRILALKELRLLVGELDVFRSSPYLGRDLIVVSEVGLNETLRAEVSSNLTRELVFVASHASHHYALMRVIAKSLGLELPADFGVAAATRSYMRVISE